MDMHAFIPKSKVINGLYFTECPFCHGELIFSDNEFVCYDCGKYGDTADYLAYRDNTSRTAAQSLIADEEIPQEIYDILNMAAQYYTSRLSNLSYLTKRNISADAAKNFRLGWADGGLCRYLKKEGADIVTAQLAGLINPNGYDKFYSRLMFPILDRQGRVLGFGGRRIIDADSPKYINSPENQVFHKKECLFGIQNLNPEKTVYVVEGYMDALSLQSRGVNAVAVLGTAVGTAHAQLLRSLNVKNIVLSLDGDEAGVKNALKGIDALKSLFDLQILCNYKDCKDPDEYVNIYGKEAFENLPKLSVDKFLLKSGVNPVDIL